jgi:CRP-like cAMP-binding protein
MTICTLQPKPQFFKSREHLPLIPNALWSISSGVVKTYTIIDNGKIITLGFWGDEDVVGQSLSTVRPYFIECITDVEAFSISLEQSSQVCEAIISHGRHTKQLMYIVRIPRVQKRLWLLLESLANRFGYVVKKGKLIDLRLTHQELADTIGTTRITVTKLLNSFEREDLISRHRNKSIILHHHRFIS